MSDGVNGRIALPSRGGDVLINEASMARTPAKLTRERRRVDGGTELPRQGKRDRRTDRPPAGSLSSEGGGNAGVIVGPLNIGIAAVPDRFSGMADAMAGTSVTGWAINETSPSLTTCVSVFVDSEQVATIACDLPRDDLRDAGYRGPGGGFSYTMPDCYLDGESHFLRLAFEDGTPLAFKSKSGGVVSEVLFRSEREEEASGFVDGFVGSGIRGWAIRRNVVTGAVSGNVKVQVLCGGVPIAEFIAGLVRQDVAQAMNCSPHVGFDFQIPAEYRTGAEYRFTLRALPEGTELQQSPITFSYPSTDAISRLYMLRGAMDELCARAWTIQRQVMRMLPTGGRIASGYDAWARRYYADLRERTAALPPIADPPLVSVVVPVYRPVLHDFMAAAASVTRQTYANWELIIVDDASGSRALSACLAALAASDTRIRVIRHRSNRGISAATNTAIRNAVGSYVVLFDHDDLLEDVAIETMVRAARASGAAVLYSDEDKIDETGSFSEPNLKPDWNYRLLVCQNYICHLLMVERETLRRAGPMRSKYDGAQDHDLLLRLSETCAHAAIQHVPELLYHWRKSSGSTASSGDAKPYAVAAGQGAVRDHLRRAGFAAAEVTPIGPRTMYSVSWGLTDEPDVCIIVPFKDQAAVTRRCVAELCANTAYANWRIVLVDNGSDTADAKRLCMELRRDPRVTLMQVPEKFNYARLNNLAAKAHPAEFFVFLNNDVFVSEPGWLRALVDEALADPKVAIAGARLMYPNRTIQHAGIVLGVGGIADHVGRGLPPEDPGFSGRAWCAQQYSAVTAACMLCRADAFWEVDGFDEVELAVAYNDVDLCLKVGQRGWRVIWTPAATAEHHESLSRGDDMAPSKAARFFRENQVMLDRWGPLLRRDPFYNPLFSREDGIFSDLQEVGTGR